MLTSVPQPFPVPIGLRLNQAARAVERAFDEALGEADGTLPVWLVLLNLKIRKPANQRELAEAVGVREATLTHHLNTMDARGLIARTRDAANRRVQVVTLTEAGEEAFLRMRDAAMAFDAKLRTGLADGDLATLGTLLDRLAANVTPAAPGSAPATPGSAPAAPSSAPAAPSSAAAGPSHPSTTDPTDPTDPTGPATPTPPTPPWAGLIDRHHG
jgi:MarR family transcriptional regulator, transcriptional regulator for hemolysin